MQSIVVVGTNHNIQRYGSQKEDFKSYLVNLCISRDIKVIAEEINDNAENTVARGVCQELNIDYNIIDPNPAEYAKFGIEPYHKIESDIMFKYNLDFPPLADNGTPLDALSEFNSRIRDEHCHSREVE